MLWAIAVLLVVLWLGGFLLDLAGGFIHLLLLLALAVVLFNVFKAGANRVAS